MDAKQLIACYQLDGNGNGKLLCWRDLQQALKSSDPLWIHLDASFEATKSWLREYFSDSLLAQAMVSHESRPRCWLEHDRLFLNLRAINLNPGQDPEDMVSVRIILTNRLVITCRQRRLLSIDDIRKDLQEGVGPKNPVDVLLKLIGRITDRAADFLDKLDESLGSIEETVSCEPSKVIRPQLSDLRREIVLVRKYLAPQREALSRLFNSQCALFSSMDNTIVGEQYERLARLIEDLDALRDRSNIVQEELTSRLSELLDKRMYILALVTVVFLPISFITSLLGVNVGGIPGASATTAFWHLCLILGLLGGGTGAILHFKRWF